MMLDQPDGVEVVATREEAERLASPPLLIVDTMLDFLNRSGLGQGPLSWSRIGDGNSNITYRLERGGQVFVLRRGPRPPLAKSTHDMMREAKIQRLVGAAGVAVPEILAASDDLSILGVPFYLMKFVDGIIITDEVPAESDSLDRRRETSFAAVQELARLHSVDVTSGEIAILGRPEGYLRRQVERFSSLWPLYSQRELPQVDSLAAWLLDHLPTSQAASMVHGDYRLGNLMFAADAPTRVQAILDWEMATLGDPLADLGYLTATYAEKGSEPNPLELTSVTRQAGFLTRDELVEAYAQASTHSLNLDALPWYQGLALWKAAIFCEDIYTRWLKGERDEDSEFAPTLEHGVPALLRAAEGFARLHRNSAAAVAVRVG